MTYRRAAVALAALCAIVGAAPAEASWRGSPGKIAYLDRGQEMPLKVWTPKLGQGTAVTVRAETFHFLLDANDTTPMTIGFPSAPAWSPDGSKLAFAAKVPDPGLGGGTTHTAIFVWTLKTNSTQQITTPPPGKVDPPGDSLSEGFAYADYSPAWSPDGTTLAFVRMTGAGEDEPVYAQRGANIRMVSLNGGGSTELTHMYGDEMFSGLAWGGDPEGQSKLVGWHGSDASKIQLLDVDPASGSTTPVLTGQDAAMVTDFDVTPDGLAIEYVQAGGAAFRKPFGGSAISLGAGFNPADLRSSPNNNGPLHFGLTTIPGVGQRGGIVERQAPDPGGDVWTEDPKDRWVNGLTTMYNGPIAYATPGRLLWDVQAQQLPILNIPGFAGSDILCNGSETWPPGPFGNDARLQAMRLTADGKGNLNCPGAGPTQDPNADDGFVSSVFGQDIYKPQEDFIEQIAPGERGWRFSWDWRKAPSESITRLDDAIEHILDTDFARKQGLERVVLYGHSYGGLLMRRYVDLHPEKVARMLTAGTPFWGAPKSLYFVSAGVENPLSGAADLDSFLPNADAKAFARDLAGAYHLFPSANYGDWLRVGQTMQDATGTRNWFDTVAGANTGLIDEARAWHVANDGFTTAQGTVEVRAVISTGLLSIGGVDVAPEPLPGGEIDTLIRLVDGDITVPTRSAGQGSLGTHTPLGAPVHVQAVCGVKHMDLGGNVKVTEPYADYLLTGRTPRKTEGACKPSGFGVKIAHVDLTPEKRSRSAATAVAGVDPEQAALDGRIQWVDVPGGETAVIDDRDPVALALADAGEQVKLIVTRYDDGEEKSTVTYSPAAGSVVFTPNADGTAAVTVDGTTVEPDGAAPDDPPADPTPTPDPGTGGGTTTAPQQQAAAPTTPVTSPVKPATTVKKKKAKKCKKLKGSKRKKCLKKLKKKRRA